MIRDVNLVSYLPPFMAKFEELVAALEAENPEFSLIWQETDRVLKNVFIETADEYGIARFEKILNILPSVEETLEDRRFRVITRYGESVPYTKKSLEAALKSLCGEKGYNLVVSPETYTVNVKVALAAKSQSDAIAELLERILPCNMIFSVELLYNTWKKSSVTSWGAVSSFTWRELREEEIFNG